MSGEIIVEEDECTDDEIKNFINSIQNISENLDGIYDTLREMAACLRSMSKAGIFE